MPAFDGGNSRAALIPKTHNYPGFVEGIAGSELLSALRRQAGEYGMISRMLKSGNWCNARQVSSHTLRAAR